MDEVSFNQELLLLKLDNCASGATPNHVNGAKSTKTFSTNANTNSQAKKRLAAQPRPKPSHLYIDSTFDYAEEGNFEQPVEMMDDDELDREEED